jgi:hypothetical protein
MSDVTIHIDETLNERSMQALGEDIAHHGGIEHVDYSQKNPHLMVVRYDQNQLNSQAVLAAFIDHGLHAELIGF